MSITATAQRSAPAQAPISAALWIDVRTVEEFAEQHRPGAINLPLDEVDQLIVAQVPDRTQRIALSCRSGHRSGIALGILTQLGYTNAYNAGGIADALSAP